MIELTFDEWVHGQFYPEGEQKEAARDGWNAAIEQAQVIIRNFVGHYPPDVFLEPPHGQHGATVDACSAAAIRHVLPDVADTIYRLRS